MVSRAILHLVWWGTENILLTESPSEPPLGVFVIVVTPARIAQFLYDKAKLLAAARLGWLGLIATMGRSTSLLV